MRSARTVAIKGRSSVMFRCRVARDRGTKGKFIFVAKRPAVLTVFFREIDAAIVPGVAVAAVTGFHGNERGTRGIGGGVFEKGTGRAGLVLAAIEEG